MELYFDLFILLIIVFVALSLQIIIHECGHMIGGLLSGYRFLFIRFGSFTILNENNKIVFKRYTISGTAGQCIMEPMEKTNFKYRLYFSGGVIGNLLLTIIAIPLLFLDIENLNLLGVELIFFGIYSIILNGIPLKIGGIVNDGYHVFKMKNEDAIKLYNQIKMTACIIAGKSYHQIDDTLYLCDEKNTSNFYDGYLIFVKALKYMELDEYEKAKDLFLSLVNDKNCINFYRMYAKMNLILIEVMFGNNNIDQYIDKKLMKMIKAQKYDLFALLSYYCILRINNDKKALKVEQKFLKYKDLTIDKGEVPLHVKHYKMIKEKLK